MKPSVSLLRSVGAMSATAAPSPISKSGTTSTLTTGTETVTVTGGAGPFTYSWALSAQTGTKTVVATSPTGASTAFQITGSGAGDTGKCNAICTVTDTSNSRTAPSNTVTVSIINSS